MYGVDAGLNGNLQDHVTLCFTTTNKGRDLFEDKVDSGPFASRCVNIKLVNRGLVTDGEDSDGNKLPGAFTWALSTARQNVANKISFALSIMASIFSAVEWMQQVQ